MALIASGSVALAQSTWLGTTTNLNTTTNYSPNITIASGQTTNQVIFNSAALPAGSNVELTADLQFSHNTGDAFIFQGDSFNIGGNSTSRRLTIGGQGLGINTTNTITFDVARVRRNATNTIAFLGSGGNVVMNSSFSTNLTSSSNTTRIDFSGASAVNNTITFNGDIVFGHGTETLGAGALGALTLGYTGSGTGANNRVVLNNVNNSGITGNISIAAGTALQLGNGSTGGNITGSGTITNNGQLIFNKSTTVEQGVDFNSGAISGGGSLVQSGSGTTRLTAANTFSGGVVINAGTLAITASERLNNVSLMTLNGGTFSTGGFTETLGVLDLNGTGVLDLGTTGLLRFDSSSSESWSGALTIAGTFVSGSSVRFGTDATGLQTSQLALISVLSSPGTVGINDSGYLIVIPEPATYAALIGLGVLGFAAWRRRRA